MVFSSSGCPSLHIQLPSPIDIPKRKRHSSTGNGVFRVSVSRSPCLVPIEVAGSAESAMSMCSQCQELRLKVKKFNFEDCVLISWLLCNYRSKSRSVDSTQQPTTSSSTTTNQLQFPTTLDDLISLNPFKEKEKDLPTVQEPQQPPKEHIVKESDTITSIAASYDVTPSELIRVNRLSTRVIFPGQVLKVPPRSLPISDNSSEQALPKTPPVYQRKFIKIHVKHITDGNVSCPHNHLYSPLFSLIKLYVCF